jgi:FxLD family lantipeptide
MNIVPIDPAGAPEDDGPFAVSVEVITEAPGATAGRGCNTDDGCASTCASSCASRG